MQKLFRAVYSSVTYLTIPLILARLWIKSMKYPAYRQRIRERFSIAYPQQFSQSIWLHAVSVGEVLAAVPLIRLLLQAVDLPIVVSTTTPTGAARLKDILGDAVTHIYAPYDIPWVVKRFLKRMRPSIAIILETEIWPNYWRFCKKNAIPICIVNATLSDKSFKAYAAFSRFFQEIMVSTALIAAQSIQDAKRFQALGAQGVVVYGNMKFDIQLPSDLGEKTAVFKSLWRGRPVLLAASTHEGEEQLLLQYYCRLKAEMPDLLLVLVPRHPQRFSTVFNLCVQYGLSVCKRTETCYEVITSDIFLSDTMGELLPQYAAADLCFVGGSLVPIGGHNLLEPAVLGKPILVGPYIDNVKSVAQSLQQKAGLIITDTADAFYQAVKQFFLAPEKKIARAAEGKIFIAANAGATAANFSSICKLLRDQA